MASGQGGRWKLCRLLLPGINVRSEINPQMSGLKISSERLLRRLTSGFSRCSLPRRFLNLRFRAGIHPVFSGDSEGQAGHSDEEAAAPETAEQDKKDKNCGAGNSEASVVIQSPEGAEITPEEIISRVGEADAIYIRVDHNAAYWVRGIESGKTELWA